MSPEGWDSTALGILGRWVGGGTPSKANPAFWEGSIPWVSPKDMRGREVADTEDHISDDAVSSSATTLVPQGSVLIVTRSGVLKHTLPVAVARRPLAINQDLKALLPGDHVNGVFAFHLISWLAPEVLRQCAKVGTTVESIDFGALRELRVTLPPLREQRKIAAILSSVDDAIESTQAVIDQLQVVKKAMMAELLTRGLPGRHTRFKQTEIGETPEEWDVVLLDSVAKRGSGHTPSKDHPEYWGGNIKWVSLKDSSALDRLYISDTAATITPLGIENSSAVEHPAGTVVLSRDAGVGKSAITTDVMAVSQHFMAWVCGPRLNNHFLYYLLQQMKPRFEHIATGNTIKTIGLPYFKALMVPVPNREEQDQIATALTAVDLRTFEERRAMDAARTLKSALMSVLLTGEVRVRPDEAAAA